MKVAIALGVICVVASTSLMSCSSASPRSEYIASSVRITPDDEVNPKRIRFDVYGDPFPHIELSVEEKKLPMHEQLALVMRRNAEINLRELGYCPHGSTGPDVVLKPENDRRRLFFYVDCLPAISK